MQVQGIKIYRKILIISPGFIFVQKTFLWAYFWGRLFSEWLIIGGNFAFHNGMNLTIKTANPNSPWAYIWEGLLSEKYLHLRFGGLICRRAYFWRGLLSEFLRYAKSGAVINYTKCIFMKREVSGPIPGDFQQYYFQLIISLPLHSKYKCLGW